MKSARELLCSRVPHRRSSQRQPRLIDRRKRQSKSTAEIYGELRAAGADHDVVLGDVNDTPDSEALRPLLTGTA